MEKLHLLTCTPAQAKQLVGLGISSPAIIYQSANGATDIPAWTFAELAAMIGPKYSKPDLWNPERMREKSATDPNSYPLYLPDRCLVFDNAAQAAAAGLIWLLEGGHLDPYECMARYSAIFFKP